MIEFCFDRILVHLYDQLLIYDISQTFELLLVRNVENFGSGFCGSSFFLSRKIVLMMFCDYVAKYEVEENILRRSKLSKAIRKATV